MMMAMTRKMRTEVGESEGVHAESYVKSTSFVPDLDSSLILIVGCSMAWPRATQPIARALYLVLLHVEICTYYANQLFESTQFIIEDRQRWQRVISPTGTGE
jgi:hypothetical protein